GTWIVASTDSDSRASAEYTRIPVTPGHPHLPILIAVGQKRGEREKVAKNLDKVTTKVTKPFLRLDVRRGYAAIRSQERFLLRFFAPPDLSPSTARHGPDMHRATSLRHCWPTRPCRRLWALQGCSIGYCLLKPAAAAQFHLRSHALQVASE